MSSPPAHIRARARETRAEKQKCGRFGNCGGGRKFVADARETVAEHAADIDAREHERRYALPAQRQTEYRWGVERRDDSGEHAAESEGARQAKGVGRVERNYYGCNREVELAAVEPNVGIACAVVRRGGEVSGREARDAGSRRKSLTRRAG